MIKYILSLIGFCIGLIAICLFIALLIRRHEKLENWCENSLDQVEYAIFGEVTDE